MNFRGSAFILAVACVQAGLFVWCIHVYLEACNGFSVGVGDFAVAPVFHVAWLVLSFPLGLLRLLLPRTYTVAALGYGSVVPDALLWGWCAHRFYRFVRRDRQAHPGT